ncbi:MAG TPA: hypothetical protein VGP68_06605 [Gemmataceae bacterium]|jgi:hypothetical protein|nr:hypothetical protein [Gemmataceae bacterium]
MTHRHKSNTLMDILIQMEATHCFPPKPAIPQQTTFPTLARFLAKVYDDHVAPHEGKRALFEPRRIAAPEGYHSTKCVAAGLYALLTQARLAANDGEVLPTEVTGSTFCYRVLEHRVPIYFVDEEFARAVAATQLPDDFTFGDLNWPQLGMVVGWPPRFMREYTGREFTFIWAANCPAGRYLPKGLERAPVIEVPEGRSKIGWFYYACANSRPECFVSAYLTKDKLAEGIAGYTYTDFMGEEAAKVQADKELTECVSALMLKLLVILNMRPSLITHGIQERPRKVKHGRAWKRELWSANFIGRGYRLARERQGTHASPRIHIRRGHVTWQITGPRKADAFISASVLPRDDRGVIDWEKVAPETRATFLRCHKRLWLEPVLIGGNG